MENTIVLTMKEERRVEVIQRVFRAEMTMVEAALVLRVTERQSYRIKAKIREEGVRGVIHGDRGRRCAWKLSEKAERKIVEAARGKYRGFNDHHLTEKLDQEQGIKLSREKVRLVLRSQGIGSPRRRRPPKHRSRRERREAEGMMVQIDGSPHDWLEGRGPFLCLVGAIDDATSKVGAAFFEEQETSAAYLRLFSEVGKCQGLPQSAYADRHSIFWTDRKPTVEEQLAGKRPRTQVGRALEELGITLIPAGSPQAKGRIERLWGTFQDRLVSELRLAGAKSKEQAQVVLDHFLPQHNRQFAKPAVKTQPAWRKVDPKSLEQSLCFKYQRVVAKDNTVRFKGAVFQIPKGSPYLSYANKKIQVHVLLDGAVEFFYQGERIARFDSETAHTIGLYRTNGRREVFSYGPDTTHPALLYELPP
jgi:transposase